MAKKKFKRKSPTEVRGTVEVHHSGWRARIWHDNKNQAGPTRHHHDEAVHDLLMVRGGLPIQRFFEFREPTAAPVEQAGNSYRVRYFFDSENGRMPCRPTGDDVEADLMQCQTKGVPDFSSARGRQLGGASTNADAEASLAVAVG